jgi:DNA-binding NarL/FixJ family response regulator
MRLKIGICEDDSFTRFTLAAALAFADVQVVFSAADAASAIAEAKVDMPHAAVIDLHLGSGPNGVDLARSLRKLSPEIGIVFLTSFETPRLLEKTSIIFLPVVETVPAKLDGSDQDQCKTPVTGRDSNAAS